MTVCLELRPSCSYIRLSLSTKFCHIKNIVLTFKMCFHLSMPCPSFCQVFTLPRLRFIVAWINISSRILFFKTSLPHGLRYWLRNKCVIICHYTFTHLKALLHREPNSRRVTEHIAPLTNPTSLFSSLQLINVYQPASQALHSNTTDSHCACIAFWT